MLASVSDSIVIEITEWKSSTGGTIKLDKTAGANGTGTTCTSGRGLPGRSAGPLRWRDFRSASTSEPGAGASSPTRYGRTKIRRRARHRLRGRS